MSQVDVLDLDGKVVEQIELPESVFNGEVKLPDSSDGEVSASQTASRNALNLNPQGSKRDGR